jgi:hypothetical protein
MLGKIWRSTFMKRAYRHQPSLCTSSCLIYLPISVYTKYPLTLQQMSLISILLMNWPIFYLIRCEVLPAVKMSILIFWVVTQWGLVGTYQRFGETYCLCLLGWSPESRVSMFLRNVGIYIQIQRRSDSEDQHGVLSNCFKYKPGDLVAQVSFWFIMVCVWRNRPSNTWMRNAKS